jgi:two-component system sensor histidine kinase DesK
MGSNEQPAPADRDLNATPFGLFYLAFVFLPLVFWREPPTSAIVASVVACLLFVPLRHWFYRGDGRHQRWLTLAAALFGYALIPVNPGGNTFIIYALAMAASCYAARPAIALSIALVAIMAVEFLLVMPDAGLALGSVLVVALIGTMVVASILYARAGAVQNAELRLTQDEVRRLATVAERERIGRDLHDLLGHTLSVVALKSELAGKLLDRDSHAAREQIREVEAVAREALAQVREAVAGIRAAGLEAEVAAARLALLSAQVHLDRHLAPVQIEEKTELALTMALREAVTNIIRHAAAKRVEVELTADGAGVRMVIADDGRGGIERHGNGLTGMRERLQAIGGKLDVDSSAAGGTRLVLWAPSRATA